MRGVKIHIYMMLHIRPRSPVIIWEVDFTGLVGTTSEVEVVGATLDMALFTAAFSISNFGDVGSSNSKSIFGVDLCKKVQKMHIFRVIAV